LSKFVQNTHQFNNYGKSDKKATAIFG